MSGKATGWAIHSAPFDSVAVGFVLVALADECNNDGLSCFPSHDRLARAARCSTRSVIRHIATLEKDGLIVVDRPASTGRGRFNRYALVLPGKTVEGQAEALIKERSSKGFADDIWSGNDLERKVTDWHLSKAGLQKERCHSRSRKVTQPVKKGDTALSQDPTTTQLLPELSSEKFDALSEDL